MYIISTLKIPFVATFASLVNTYLTKSVIATDSPKSYSAVQRVLFIQSVLIILWQVLPTLYYADIMLK